jgi:hypothetical protein
MALGEYIFKPEVRCRYIPVLIYTRPRLGHPNASLRRGLPGLSSMLVPGLVFAFSIATFRSNAFQRLILKQGRDVGEIRPALNLLMIASGILLVGIGSAFVVWR